MKKNLVYAMMSAIALTSAVSFTGCASDDGATVDTNPTYDGTSVRTDFAFSITKAAPGTRMSGATVQEGTTQEFRGIKEMFLLPFNAKPGTATSGTVSGTTTNAASYYLGNLTKTDITSTANSNGKVIDRETATSSKVYSLTLPIHTNNFLFYGIADGGGSSSYFENGHVTRSGLTQPTSTSPSVAVDISNIKFSLNPIASQLEDATKQDSTKLVTYLTSIANATAGTTYGSWAETVDKVKTDNTYKALSELYQKFIGGEQPRAGSTEGVTRLLLDLYRSALKINEESSVTAVDEIAQAICTAILNTSGTVKLNVDTTDPDANKWTATLTGVTSNFPADLKLPMGAAQLTWNSTAKKFDYNYQPLNFGPGSNNMVVGKYRYPAELIYFDNSPLRATNTYIQASAYPKTAKAWDELYQLTTWADTEVKSSTRAVAMTNNVNYGVALLQTNVKLVTPASNAGYTDNMANVLQGATENQTNIAATAFTVTGLLIGGQPREVQWDMTNPNDGFTDVIYDNAIAFSGNLTTSYYDANNYTMVFDNYTNKNADTPGTLGDQKSVRIALEIKNGPQDFYGINGLIPANSTFYLVGELDPANPKTGYTRPDYHGGTDNPTTSTYRITKEDVQRVFMQDYKTIVNIIIGETALQKAYSTIPDLRSTEVVFGLSVDMTWEKGVEFEMTLN